MDGTYTMDKNKTLATNSGARKVTKKPPNAAKADKPIAEAPKKMMKTKQSTFDIVFEAIQTIGDNRKGLSAQAIKKYVEGKSDIESGKLKVLVNKALIRGVEKGIFGRPKNNKSSGASGSFVINKNSEKPKNPKKLVKKSPDDIDGHASDSEVTKKPIKQRKRNLSESAIEFESNKTSTPKPVKIPRANAQKMPKVNKAKRANPKENAEERKDLSDSEFVVKKQERKHMKSYSSDSQLNIVEKKTVATKKKTKAQESGPENVKPEIPVKSKIKKLYSSENDEKEKTKTRAKTRAKNK